MSDERVLAIKIGVGEVCVALMTACRDGTDSVSLGCTFDFFTFGTKILLVIDFDAVGSGRVDVDATLRSNKLASSATRSLGFALNLSQSLSN